MPDSEHDDVFFANHIDNSVGSNDDLTILFHFKFRNHSPGERMFLQQSQAAADLVPQAPSRLADSHRDIVTRVFQVIQSKVGPGKEVLFRVIPLFAEGIQNLQRLGIGMQPARRCFLCALAHRIDKRKTVYQLFVVFQISAGRPRPSPGASEAWDASTCGHAQQGPPHESSDP